MEIDEKLLAFLRRLSFHPHEDVFISCAVLFTPSLKSSVFVNGTDVWKRTMDPEDVPVEHRDRFKLLQSLYTLVQRLNTRLVLSMASHQVNERKFAHNAMQDVPRQGSSVDWFHGVLQVILLDRVIFSVAGHSPDYIPSYQRLQPAREKEPEGLEKIFKAYRDWEGVMNRFCETWETSTTSSSICNEVDTSHREEKDGILSCLVREARRSHGKAKWNIIFNNFCFAAMGLRALMLVSTLVFLGIVSVNFLFPSIEGWLSAFADDSR